MVDRYLSTKLAVTLDMGSTERQQMPAPLHSGSAVY